MRESDIPKLVAMVTAHEGEASGKMAIHWFDRQPQGVQVFRDSAEEPAGFVAMVGLHRASAEDVSIDPAVQEVWRYLQQHTPLRSGEKATLFRFWLAHDTYQAVSPIQSLIFVSAVQHYLITPALAFTFFPCANPDFWAPMFAYADLMRIPEADYEVGGHRYGVFGHDWRAVPPAAWLALLAEREVAADVQTTAPPVETEPLVVLSKPAFESAVRTALHDFSLPAALETNPLLRSRLIVERAGRHAADTARAAVLQSVLKEACESLHASPREVKFYRVLHHTYLHPAATQEQAAELLDIPFGTFRRHLKRGISRVVEVLWRYEIGGLEK